jgi:PST family polysaccharide transporter
MMGYGLGILASDRLWELRNLVNPLVVGRYAGTEAVGQVAFAIRLAELLSSMLLIPVGRLSIPVLARLQGDRAKLVQAVAEGTTLQLMVLGPLLAGFSLVGPWIIPLLLGSQWLSALEVYPFIALSYLSGATFMLQSSALYVLRKTWEVAIFHLVHLVLFAGSALLLIPNLGLTGYGWAEVAALLSYILLPVWFHLYVGRLRYAQVGVWYAAWALPLFSWQLGPWIWVSVIVPLIWPVTRRELTLTVTTVLRKPYRH